MRQEKTEDRTAKESRSQKHNRVSARMYVLIQKE